VDHVRAVSQKRTPSEKKIVQEANMKLVDKNAGTTKRRYYFEEKIYNIKMRLG
jgi:hypothetical protein